MEYAVRLYLVRHATPLSQEEDPARPLSRRGRKEAESVAAFIARREGVTASRIFHSAKTRAMETAEIIAAHLNLIGNLQETDALKPNDDPAIWEERLAGWEEDVMLVGHLPHLDRLAALLICRNPDVGVIDFPPAGTACLARNDAGGWKIEWMVAPGILA
jgi:phosphohistidine phosphatase